MRLVVSLPSSAYPIVAAPMPVKVRTSVNAVPLWSMVNCGPQTGGSGRPAALVPLESGTAAHVPEKSGRPWANATGAAVSAAPSAVIMKITRARASGSSRCGMRRL